MPTDLILDLHYLAIEPEECGRELFDRTEAAAVGSGLDRRFGQKCGRS